MVTRKQDQLQQETSLPVREQRSESTGSFVWNQQNDLRHLAHISPLYPVLKSIWGLVPLGIAVALFLFWGLPLYLEDPTNTLVSKSLFCLRICAFIVLSYLAYWEAYRRMEKVEINGFRLEVTKGVLWKTRGSVHLLPHTTFFVTQKNFLYILLRLADLQVIPAFTPEPETVSISGLPVDRAHQLRSYLSQQTDRQLGTRSRPGEDAEKRRELKRSIKSRPR
jgi:membrane protein YdbS with pleckstrin-like domain